MEIQLLGSCHVAMNGRPLVLRRRQVRALLYRLAAQDAPVPRAQIAFLFWPDQPDAVARRLLTRLISGLRASLPDPSYLIVDEETVALNPAVVRSDSREFLRGCASDDPAVLAEAVALYCGPFMAGFDIPESPEYELWQSESTRRYQMLHLQLLERLVDHATATGELGTAIRYAQRYLEADELAEPMHRRLIALYSAAGDRGAALRQLDACSLILERELGVSPLPATRAAIHSQAAATPRPSVAVLPSLDLPLIGRNAELRHVQSAYDSFAEHSDKRGGFILITGESGMGKSRLLHEFVTHLHGPALAGAFYTDSHSLPYSALIQALRATLPRRDRWRMVPEYWRSELLPLLPELRGLFPNLPMPIGTGTPPAQQRLYAALTRTFCAFADEQPLLLCLDDLQLADEATLGWLRSLAADWSDTPLIVAATATLITPAIDMLRKQQVRAGRLAEVRLTSLGLADIQQLLAALPQTAAPGLAPRIHEITGGNPFFILEILRELQDRRQLGRPPDDLPLPTTIREALVSRIDRLSPIARQLLEAIAILDPHHDDALLQQTAARTATETVDGLDELLRQQLLYIDPHGTPTTLPVFPHTLLRITVLHTLTPWRRKLLHRRAAETLTRRQPYNAAILAQHYAAAEAWAPAIARYGEAADQACSMYAFTIALAHLEAAFALLAHAPQPETVRLMLLRRRLALRRTLVQIPEWRADAAEVVRLAVRLHDDAARLEALEAQMSLHVLQSDFALVEQTAAEALALAFRSKNRRAEARIRHTIGWHLADALGRSREGLAHLQAACELAQEVGDTGMLYQSLCNLAFAQRAEGRCAAARASAEQALALTAYLPGSPPHPAFADALRELGEANAYLGRWEEARQQLRPLLELYSTLNEPWAYGTLLYNYGLYSSNMGLHAAAIDSMRRLVALSEAVGLPADSDYGIWHRAGLARVLVAAGAYAEAGDLLGSLRTATLTPGRPYLAWAKAAAEYHLATDHGAVAAALLHPAVSWWREHASPHDADVLLLLAQAALATGDTSLAEAAVTEAAIYLAATDMRRYHLRLYAVRALVSGSPDDLARARAELAYQAALFTDTALHATFLQHIYAHYRITPIPTV